MWDGDEKLKHYKKWSMSIAKLNFYNRYKVYIDYGEFLNLA